LAAIGEGGELLPEILKSQSPGMFTLQKSLYADFSEFVPYRLARGLSTELAADKVKQSLLLPEILNSQHI